MTSIRLQTNASYTVVVSNGTLRTSTFGSDGTFTAGNSLGFTNSAGTFTGTFSATLTGNRAYTLPDRAGTVALQDSTALNAMLPTQTGHNNNFLQTDGAGNLSWATSATSAITSLNGNTSASQTLTWLNTGTAPAWTTPDGTHVQLGIPMANTASVTAGLVSNAEFTDFARISGTNTFANAPLVTATSTATNALATVGQVNAAAAGLSIRPPVAAMDIALTSLPTTNPIIDGYTIQLNDRVLFTALSTNNNKVYVATVSLNPVTWVLATDGQAGTGAPTKGDILFVDNGTARAYQQWAYEGSSWVRYASALDYTFSTGLNNTSGTITVAYGSTGTTAAVGNDARLSDARTPTAHVLDSASHTVSGETPGNVMIATSATSFGFTTLSGAIASVSNTGAVVLNTVAIGQGGTGQTSKAAAFNALSPITAIGDLIYGSGVNTSTNLVGNITTTKMFLNQTGTGAASQAPQWSALVAGDIPSLPATQITSGVLSSSVGGTGVGATSPKFTFSPWRLPVKAVATTNTTISGPGASIDGYAASAGDRILLTGQTTTNQNGIWVWNGAAAAMTRPEDYPSSSTIAAYVDLIVCVLNGTVNAGTDWRLSTTGAITVDTTGTAWAQITTNIGSGSSGILPIANGGTGLNSTTQNFIFAGPTSGSGAPLWRAMVYNDLAVHNFIDTTKHPISGKTAGQVVLATAATTYDFVTLSGDVSTVSGAGAVVIGAINSKPIGNLGLTINTATLADNTATASLVTGASWPVATYRSVKLMYQITRGTNYSVGWINMLYDGTNARITIGEDDSFGSAFGTIPPTSNTVLGPLNGLWLTADINGGNLRLLYQANSTGTATTMYFNTYPFPL